ncbi:AmmeMemoRadiSam system radical SAM enzyme [Clostridium baratii]|nr:radical SAM protein [Clostridium baratii]OPF53655.1 AmmeMemoRadiSam system radical SAM enzyme [Clostridium baratii]OPF57755.1 AmmeMemoRadiSam system radical SAM enzyme [Clostridium baratii]OPF60749.1 AmmeMemoRadiSam system radical SAM enzyme [Clostridium baratii]
MIRCYLCPHNCLIKENEVGRCKVRKAISTFGELKLYTLNYGNLTSAQIDPIEKKPLSEFYPGSKILSVGSFGCNFTCSFCQNYSISQERPHIQEITPEELASIVCTTKDNLGVAFTYNEPSIWYEFVYETSKIIKEMDSSKKVVIVTNGYISEEPLKKLLPFVDAMNVDLKGDDCYYKRLCTGRISPVKNTIKLAKEFGVHVEVTTLLVPGENTNDEFLKDLSEFIGGIDKNMPLHLSRYFPRYKMEKDFTSLSEMKEAYRSLSLNLNNIYLGNLSEGEKKYILN